MRNPSSNHSMHQMYTICSHTVVDDDDSDEEEHSGGDKRRELQNSCSFDSGNVSDGEEENEDSSDSDCDGASCQSSDVPGQRSRHAVVVKLVCGVLGLGLTVGTDRLKNVVVTKIRRFSAAATHGELRSVTSVCLSPHIVLDCYTHRVYSTFTSVKNQDREYKGPRPRVV